MSGLAEAAVRFRGTLGLRSAVFGNLPRGLLLYPGIRGDTVFALIGSAHHLVGSHPPESVPVGHSGSTLPQLFTLLRRDRAEWDDRRDVRESARPVTRRPEVEDAEALQDVLACSETIRGPQQTCEFLARRLFVGTTRTPDGAGVRVVVGTPLYVPLSDGRG